MHSVFPSGRATKKHLRSQIQPHACAGGKLLGFDHEALTYRYAGRDFRLTDVFGKVIKELIA